MPVCLCPHLFESFPIAALPRELAALCSFLQARYLQVAAVIQLNQLKSGNELSSCFGAFVEIEELQGRCGVRLVHQFHLRDGKGLAKELGGALWERRDGSKIPVFSHHLREKIITNFSQSGTPQHCSALIFSAPPTARSR